ncbi:hypothetical protein [Fulvivirga sp.]|uniref:hypothetical protein n=1 Tax=Fulvivirga sp. TaxID=1931237 RepID=UPI0032EDF855
MKRMKRMKKAIFLVIILGISLGLKAQDESVNGILFINKNISPSLSPFSVLRLSTTPGVYDGNSGPAIEFSTNIGLGKIGGVDERVNNIDQYRGGLVFKTRLHTAGNDFGFYERMRISAYGNVGIGITNPSVKLDVSGSVQASNMGRFKGWTTGGESGLGFEVGTSSGEGYAYVYDRTNNTYGTMHIQNVIHTSGNNGNVGIGNANPNSKLHLRDQNGNASLIIQSKQDNTVGNNAELILSTEYSTANNTSGNNAGRKALIRATARYNWGMGVRLGFFTSSSDSSYPTERMVVAPNGNVGIGSINPAHKLDVNGTIHASEVLVDLNFPGPDYVFEEDYPLSSLSEIESYIKANKHLPEVPSAAQMKEEGVNIVQMQMLLLKKVEELTLHVIDLKKENSLLRDELELIKK